MEEEINMINKNDTLQLVPRLENRHIIRVKRVCKTKFNYDYSIFKFKAKLVVKGYGQLTRMDYGDTFASVARDDTIKLLVALVVKLN